jgi:hypothetical protein
MAKITEEKLKKLLKRYGAATTNRSTANGHWQEISEVMYPTAGRFFSDKVEGQKVMGNIYASFPMIANQLLASAEFSLLTSPSSHWFRVQHPNEQMNNDLEVARWFELVTKIMFAEIHRPTTGFTSAMHEGYLEYNPFGNITIFVDESEDKNSLRFQALPLATTYYINNEAGDTVGLYRKYVRTIGKLAERFGAENLSTPVQQKYHKEKYDEEVECVHIIIERESYDPELPISTNKPFASIWVDVDNKHVMLESGYDEQPFAAAPFFKNTGDEYGSGPGSIALPAVKMLMRVAQTTIRGAQKAIDPPLLVPDKGTVGPVRTYAGGITYYKPSARTRNPVDTLKGADPKLGVEYMEYIKEDIKQAFYIDQLQLGEGPQMTATEVIQRTEERLRLMGPWLGRLQVMLSKILFRVYRILRRAGVIPPPPKIIAGAPMKIVFTSPIARAQEQIEAQGLMRAMEILQPVMDRKPESLDIINNDELTRGVWDMFSVSPRYLNTDAEVKKVRKARAEQENAKQESENLRDAGQGANALAQAAGGITGGKVLNFNKE